MAFDEKLAARIREILSTRNDVEEKRMFGGLCFMVAGQMAVGVEKAKLMVRVGPDAFADALAQPHAEPMDFTGRPLKGFVYVTPAGTKGAALKGWIERAIAGVKQKAAAKKKPAAKTKPVVKKKRSK